MRAVCLIPAFLIVAVGCADRLPKRLPDYEYTTKWPQAFDAYWGYGAFERVCVPFDTKQAADAGLYDLDNCSPKAFKDGQQNDEILKRLPNINAFTMTRMESGSGQLEGYGQKGKSEGLTQILHTDYAQYRVDEDADTGCLLLSGVGLRIKLRFTEVSATAKGKISGVEYGAVFKHAKGSISYSTFGIEGPLAIAVASMPKPISKETIDEVMTKADRLLVQIRDAKLTRLNPMVFGEVCPNAGTDVRKTIDELAEVRMKIAKVEAELTNAPSDNLEKRRNELLEAEKKLLSELSDLTGMDLRLSSSPSTRPQVEAAVTPEEEAVEASEADAAAEGEDAGETEEADKTPTPAAEPASKPGR